MCRRASLTPSLYSLTCAVLTANVIYVKEKERCKELLDISKAKLDEVDEETRNAFKAMEEVRPLLLRTCVFVLKRFSHYSRGRRTSEAQIS